MGISRRSTYTHPNSIADDNINNHGNEHAYPYSNNHANQHAHPYRNTNVNQHTYPDAFTDADGHNRCAVQGIPAADHPFTLEVLQ